MGARKPDAAVLDGPTVDAPLVALLRLLADGASDEAIGIALAEGLLREMRPTQLAVFLRSDDGTELVECVRYGIARDPGTERVPVDLPLPMTEVFRTGRAASWTMPQAAQAFPAVAGWIRSHPERADDEVFILPVRAQGRPVGTLLVSLAAPAERSWELSTSLESAAAALGVWSLYRSPALRTDGRRARPLEVTERQARIVAGIRDGRSNAEIAADLGVSVGTVKADLSGLYRMFAVSQREALVALVPPSPEQDAATV